jgi:high-affinity iron transporter
MFSTALIVFREIVEISLIISIMAASTQGIKNRNTYLIKGILIGILGAIILAFFTTKLDTLFDGFGQEIFAIVNIIAAILLIGYTIIWMKQNSKELVNNIKLTGADVVNKIKPTSAIYLMIAAAVFREGSEIVLFLNGLYVSNTSAYEIIQGFLLGLGAGILFGLLLYKGLLAHLTYKYIFKVTSVLLTIFSASLAAKLANLLTAANIINCLNTPIWNSSSFIKDTSFLGRALNIIIGYEANPTGLQVIFYFATFLMFYLVVNYTNNNSLKK